MSITDSSGSSAWHPRPPELPNLNLAIDLSLVLSFAARSKFRTRRRCLGVEIRKLNLHLFEKEERKKERLHCIQDVMEIDL